MSERGRANWLQDALVLWQLRVEVDTLDANEFKVLVDDGRAQLVGCELKPEKKRRSRFRHLKDLKYKKAKQQVALVSWMGYVWYLCRRCL